MLIDLSIRVLIFTCSTSNKFETMIQYPTLTFDPRVCWLFVFNVPSTARSFRDSNPIYCPLRRVRFPAGSYQDHHKMVQTAYPHGTQCVRVGV